MEGGRHIQIYGQQESRAKKILLLKLGASGTLLTSSDSHASAAVYLVSHGWVRALAQALPSSKGKFF